MEKKSIIKTLKNVKLVIGNGFDLYCRLKTSYSNYFLHNKSKIRFFENWISSFSLKARDYTNFSSTNHKDFWIDSPFFDNANVWDFFFFVKSKQRGVDVEKWRWCDVETAIQKSLADKVKGFNWPSIYDFLCNRNIPLYEEDDFYVLAGVVYKKNGEKMFASREEFYVFLLEQLKLFEKDFGYYIYHQHFDDTNSRFGIVIPNGAFIVNAEEAINRMCNIGEVVSIDSFNYDSLYIRGLDDILYNINGTYEKPIFGIDSESFVPSDPQFIFTKTNRRMELDMLRDKAQERIEFENIIIFGHSLDAADYSYFFSILDRIDISNLEKPSTVVFVFSIYDGNQEYQIRSDLRKAIARLFHDYSIYRGNTNSPNRLLDALTTQGKVLTLEIPQELESD